MAQTTNLAAGKTAATSTDITVASGAEATIGIFTDAGKIPDNVSLTLLQDTPGIDNVVAELSRELPSVIVKGPNVFRVTRPAFSNLSVNVGVFSET
jgi:hypothetical protein